MKEIQYKKILVTYDGSQLAYKAIPHALFLAKKLHAKIFLLTVVVSVEQHIAMTTPVGVGPGIPIIGDEAVKIVEVERKMAHKKLERLKIDLEKSGASAVAIRIGEGNAGEEIVLAAKEEKMDVIVISTHGRSGLGRALLGSVTDHVVRHAQCPVLVVRA